MKNNKQVIVVIGPGRSGTSVLMQLLKAFGMTVSDKMIPAKEHNPLGPFEDSDIFETHTKLLKQLSPPSMPLPKDWLSNKGTGGVKVRLKEIIKDRIQNNLTIFGFKDPRTALFIPLWTQVFNELNLSPLYILATRQPQNVIESMSKQGIPNPEVTELFWLTKNTEALYQTGSNCFIVHYEDWFTDRAPEVAQNLIRYAGLDSFWDKSKSVTETIGKVIKPNLNRAVFNDHEIKNRYVLKLQAQLDQCRGDQFDRQSLMDVVMECRKAMDEFSGWVTEAQRFFKQKRGEDDKLVRLSNDPAKFVVEANKCLQDRKDLSDENTNLRIKISAQTKEFDSKLKESKEEKIREIKRIKNDSVKKLKGRNEKQREKISALQDSTSFQLGQIIVNAVTKPGINTILLPYNLIRLFFSSKA